MKKVIIVIYGAFSYIVFLFAFLYAIGFVGNVFVPKSIDSGKETGVTQSLLIDIALLSLFALQHSVMARPLFKEWWIKIIGSSLERCTYVLLSSIILLVLYWQWQPIPVVMWEIENQLVVMLVSAIYFFGWLVVLLSTFMINHFELFGISQIVEFMQKRNATFHPTGLKRNYFYNIVRHPIMLGFIIAFWAAPTMTLGHILFTIVTTVYILIAVKHLEESDLRKIHGSEYEKYQKEVPMIIPLTGKRSANMN